MPTTTHSSASEVRSHRVSSFARSMDTAGSRLAFLCDRCGACCKGHLIVEADDVDVLREPRLIDADRYHAGKGLSQVVREIREELKAVIPACGASCAFLTEDNHCSIYPTRPNCCVGLEAGDEQCQEARAAEGLPRLEPLPPEFPLEDAIAMGLTLEEIQQAISEQVTTALGLRRIEKNNRSSLDCDSTRT